MTRSTKLKIIIKDNVRLGISCAPPKKKIPHHLFDGGVLLEQLLINI